MRRLLTILLLVGAFAAPAQAAGPVTLMPGVTYEQTVQFTPHGAVVVHVLKAPRPGDQNGLYQLAPVLARNTVLGVRQRVTQMEKDLSATATVAGINGDLFSAADGHPSGIFMTGGVLAHPPLSARSSIGIDTAGALHVDRVKFFGTWKGTGQRRPLAGINQNPAPGQVELFTPAYGARTPRIANAASVVLQPFPAAVPNVDLTATVTAATVGGGDVVPPDGAVLMATGATAAKLQAEAPVGTALTSRLILQPAWAGVSAALGGGPVLVRNSKPVFRSLEDFTNDQVTQRDRARRCRPARRRTDHPRRGRRPPARLQRRPHELRARADAAAARRGHRLRGRPRRLGDGRVRRAAPEQAERPGRRAARQGGAPRAVLRRLRGAAAAALAQRRRRHARPSR